MYEVFGEFDSVEELNQAAAGQKEQGDKEALVTLAKENGIDEFSVEAYLKGQITELTDYFNCALGKLQIELEPIKSNRMPVEPIVDFLQSLCIEEEFARKVKNKSKSLKTCIDRVEKLAREECNRTKKQYVADMTVFHWAKEYYMEG